MVLELIDLLAEVAGRDQLALYRDLIGCERDLIRVRACCAEDDGTLSIDAGVDISILSDEFLAEVSQMEKQNLALPAGRRGADGFGSGGGTVGTMGGLSVMGDLAE